MTFVQPIMGATLGLQSAALAGHAYGMVPKRWGPGAKKMNTKKLVSSFFGIAVGTALLKPTANIVNTL